MPFRFRFERILEIKREIEDVLKGKLSSLILKRSEVERERESLIVELKLLEDEFLERQKAGLSGGEIRLYQYLISSLTFLISEKERELKDLEDRIEKKRRELLEASKERKKFERLKERAFENYLLDELYRERISLDEIGQNLFFRREGSGS